MVATYGAISLVPVLLLGLVLSWSYRAEARQRGVAEGRSEALVVAQTAVEPRLTGRPLSQGLTPGERAPCRRWSARPYANTTSCACGSRDLAGDVVYADDGAAKDDEPEDEALTPPTARSWPISPGSTPIRVTSARSDPKPVEVYLPLNAGTPARRVGVLEIYLPYAPISADVTAGLHTLYRDLVLGLAGLYLALFAISFSVSRRLRQQLRVNTYLAEHDALTDLPNRTLFLRRAADAVEAARRRWAPDGHRHRRPGPLQGGQRHPGPPQR